VSPQRSRSLRTMTLGKDDQHSTGCSMHIVMLLILAGVTAGIVNLTLHPRDGAFAVVLSIILGIIGALFGAWVLIPVFRISSPDGNTLGPGGSLLCLLSAVMLLVAVQAARGKALR